MGRCPGCGAHIWPAEETYGHILGCGIRGAEADSRETRESPWPKEVQHAILEEALEVMERDSQDRVDALAQALQDRLSHYSSLDPKGRTRYGEERDRGALVDLGSLRRELEDLRRRLSQLEGDLGDSS